MSILSDNLVQLQHKLTQVLKQYVQLQRENTKLRKELLKKDKLVKDKEELLLNLQQKVDALRISKDGFSTEEKKQLEKRIDGYVAEIDKCLSLLNVIPKV